MHRQGATSGQARRHRGRSGGLVVRFLWILGYLSVGLGALFSTFFYPDVLSLLRSQREPVSSRVFSQVFLLSTCIGCEFLYGYFQFHWYQRPSYK